MIGLVLISHGKFAEGLLSATEMILGEQRNLVAITFAPGMTPESLKQALAEAIETVDDGAGVLLLVDLFGGTPARVVSEEVLTHKVPALSGVNLPMLLEICIQRDEATLDQLRKIGYDSGHVGILDIETQFANME